MDTGSATPDIQSGYERTLNCLYPVMARATMVSGFGLLNAGLLYSVEQLVIDNEIYGMVVHRQQGIEVSEESIGIEVVRAVMDGGNFLAQEHTRNFMRRGEIYAGKLGNESPFEEWRSAGRVTVREEAKEKVEQLLAGHPGITVDESVSREINSILEEAKEDRKA